MDIAKIRYVTSLADAREDNDPSLVISCLADYAGHLDVLESGDIVYRFDARLAERDRDPWRVRIWRGIKRVGMVVLKLGIMVTLVGYSIVFTVLALALIFGLFAKSDRDVDTDWLELAWLPLLTTGTAFLRPGSRFDQFALPSNAYWPIPTRLEATK